MANQWSAGLDDDDSLSGYPSAANPLTAMGLDPDEVRANPKMLASLSDPSLASGTPAPAAAAVPTPATPPGAPPTLASQGHEGVSGELRTAKSEEDAAAALGKVDPSIGEAQKARDAAADETIDKGQYKPGIGTKIGRGLRSAGVGFLTGGFRGAALGALEPQDIKGGKAYGAPTGDYDAKKRTLQKKQATTQRSYDEALDNFKRATEARDKALSATKDAATAYGGAAGHATGLTNAETKAETEDDKTAAKLKLDEKTFNLRNQRLASDPILSKLSGLQKAYYLAKGEVYQPHETTEADELAANIARAAVVWKSSHGGKGPQTVQEFNDMIASAKGDLGKADSKADAIAAGNLRTATRLAQTNIKHLQDDLKDADPKSPEATALQTQIDEAQREYDDLSSQLSGLPKSAQTIPNNMPQVPGVVPGTPAPNAGGVPVPGALAPNQPAPAAPAAPQAKPQPAPDGTRKRAADGTVKVKQGGKWVNE